MTFYRATSSLDVVDLPEGAVLLRSDLGSCRIEGESARVLAAEVLPHLSQWTAFEDLAARLAGYEAEDVRTLLDSLVGSSMLLKSGRPVEAGNETARFLADIGLEEEAAARQLAGARIGIAGDTLAARLIGTSLERFGAGCVSRFGAARGADAGPPPLEVSKAALFVAAEELDLIIVAVDKAMLSARHWANQAALKAGCAAIFADVSALEAIVGPTVLPGETACYTCFRMRHLATSDNFAEVMAHERHLDSLNDPVAERSGFPGLAEMAAGAAVAEAVRFLFPPLSPWLANGVLRIDPLVLAFERHEVLRQPDCPHCRGIDRPVRQPGLP